MMFRKKNFIIVFIFVTVIIFNIQLTHGTPSLVDKPLSSPLYKGEGPFVEVPSSVAGTIVYLPVLIAGTGVGWTTGIICLPALPFFKKTEDYVIYFVGYPAGFVAFSTLYPVNTAAGLPFYIAKKTFYDFPVLIYNKAGENSK